MNTEAGFYKGYSKHISMIKFYIIQMMKHKNVRNVNHIVNHVKIKVPVMFVKKNIHYLIIIVSLPVLKDILHLIEYVKSAKMIIVLNVLMMFVNVKHAYNLIIFIKINVNPHVQIKHILILPGKYVLIA